MKRINLDGIENIRDLGGIENINKKRIKEKLFIRAEKLNQLSDKDILVLINEYNLKNVIDLRTEFEISELPDRKVENVKYFHLPIFMDQTYGITRSVSQDLSTFKMVPDMKELYKNMVTDEFAVSQLKIILKTIIEEENAILFHCTAGKDRTGIVAMLVLAMLDVSDDKIVEEYLETNYTAIENSKVEYKNTLEKTKDKEFAEKIRQLCIADETYLKSAINAIESEFGTLQNFIVEKLEISKETIEAFQKRVLI